MEELHEDHLAEPVPMYSAFAEWRFDQIRKEPFFQSQDFLRVNQIPKKRGKFFPGAEWRWDEYCKVGNILVYMINHPPAYSAS